jgi:hypothetical protein
MLSMMVLMRTLPVPLLLGRAVVGAALLVVVAVQEAGEVVGHLRVGPHLLQLEEGEVLLKLVNHSSLAKLNLLLLREELLLR